VAGLLIAMPSSGRNHQPRSVTEKTRHTQQDHSTVQALWNSPTFCGTRTQLALTHTHESTMLLNTGIASNTKLAQQFSLTFGQLPNTSLTAFEFSNIYRFSRQVITVQMPFQRRVHRDNQLHRYW